MALPRGRCPQRGSALSAQVIVAWQGGVQQTLMDSVCLDDASSNQNHVFFVLFFVTQWVQTDRMARHWLKVPRSSPREMAFFCLLKN